MASIAELDSVYMGTALLHAGLSKAKRAKVGACIVTRTGIIVPGVNGMPRQLGNDCEYTDTNGLLVTRPEVIHAEHACLNKCAKEGVSCEGATMYVTLACCLHCASSVIAAGIIEVIYGEDYRDMRGMEILAKHLKVRKYVNTSN